MAKVSAVIPTHNCADFVPGAVETVLKQTYGDIEAVVVNDGSTDETDDVLAPYDDIDRVRVLHNEETRGLSYSFNRGIRAADGTYICPLAADDRWHREKIKKQVQVMDQLDPEYCGVYTAGIVTHKREILDVEQPDAEDDLYPEVLVDNEIPRSSHMIRRACLKDVGLFDTDVTGAIDWDLMIRLAKKYKFGYVPQILVETQRRDDTVLEGWGSQKEALGMLWEKYESEIEHHPKVYRRFQAARKEAKAFYQIGKRSRFAVTRSFFEAFRFDHSVRYLIYGLTGLTGRRGFRLARNIRDWWLQRQTGSKTELIYER